MNTEQKYPIKAVENLTGLTAYVIRAWEKRYNAVNPDRTDTNRRLYSHGDVEKLRLLSSLRKKGYNIGSIANQPIEALKEIYGEDIVISGENTSLTKSSDNKVAIKEIFTDLIEATKQLDHKKFENVLSRASVEFSQPVLLQEIIAPFTFEIGVLWSEGVIRVAEEHFASNILSKFLTNLRDSHDIPDSAPCILITTPRGQLHELGSLMAAASAAHDGWKVVYVSTNLPVSDIISAVEKIKAKALGLSIVFPFDDLALRQDLQVLYNLLSEGVEVILGGKGAKYFKDTIKGKNIHFIDSLSEFRDILKSLSAVN